MLSPSSLSWIAFGAGCVAQIMSRADLASKSSLNGIKTRRDWLKKNAVPIAVRAFVNAAAWGYCSAYPDALSRLAAAFGMTANLALPASPPIAAFFGLGVGNALDYFSAKFGFQKEYPPLNGNGNGSTPHV